VCILVQFGIKEILASQDEFGSIPSPFYVMDQFDEFSASSSLRVVAFCSE
jgi:hypothetical protein